MQRDFPDHYLWFACEKADVQQMRAASKARQGDLTSA
jgi:hypothetical protein